MGKKIMYKKGGKKRLKKIKKRKYNVGGMYDNAPPDSYLPVQNIVYDQGAQDSVEQYENQLQHALSKRDWTSSIEHDEMLRKQKNAQLMQMVQGTMKGQNILEGAPAWLDTARGNIKSGWNKLWGKTPGVEAPTMAPGPTSSMPAITDSYTPSIDTSGMASPLNITPEVPGPIGMDAGLTATPTLGPSGMAPIQSGVDNVMPDVNLTASAPGPTLEAIQPGMVEPTGGFTQLELPPQPGGPLTGPQELGRTWTSTKEQFKNFAKRPVGKLASAGVMGAGLLGTLLSRKYDDGDPTKLSRGEKWGTGLQGFSAGASMGKMFGPLGLIAGGAIGALAARRAQNKLAERFKRSRNTMLARRGTAIQNLAMAQGAAKEYSGYDTGYGMGGYLRNMYPHGGYHKDDNTIGTQFDPVGHPHGRAKFEGGGYKYLKGGIAKPLPGGAVEFLGKTHEEGGIHLDPRTEVEDKETMDKVHGKDYFFSSHLKLGGMPYSEVHKNILRHGGNQDAINQLAAMQEMQAGRRFYRTGGFKYQNGGELPVASLDYLKEQGIIPGQQGSFTWNGIQMYGDEQLQKLIADSEGNFGTAFMNRVDPNVLKEAGITSFDQFKDKANVLKYQKAWNKLYPDNKILEDSKLGEQTIRTMKKQETITLDPVEIKKLDTGPLPELIKPTPRLMEDTPVEDEMPKVPWYKRANWGQIGAIGAGLLQLLPAIKASKDKPDYLTGVPQMPKSYLDRVRLTHARDNVRNQFHSMSKSIDDSGLGPAGIAAKMAAYGKQTDAISKIDAKEKMMNVDIDTKEKKMNQYTNMFNIKNYLAADEFNRAADAATKDRKLGALQAGVQGFAGVMGDILNLQAAKEHAQAISGDSGVYERNAQKKLWNRVKDMPRFEGMTEDQFYENYNYRGQQNAKTGGFKYALGGQQSSSFGPPGTTPEIPAMPVNLQGTGTPPPRPTDPTTRDRTPRTNNTTGFLDMTQKVLQVGGNFPLLGAVPDLLNAGISKGRAYMTDDPVLKAQYNVDAATNLVSAVPGPGDVVGFGATIDAFTGNKGRDAIAANLMQQSTPVPEQRLLAQNRKGGYRKLKKRKKQIYG